MSIVQRTDSEKLQAQGASSLEQYDFAKDEEFLVCIFRELAASKSARSWAQFATNLVAAGSLRMCVPAGFLLKKISHFVYEIAAYYAPDSPEYFVGKHLVSATRCATDQEFDRYQPEDTRTVIDARFYHQVLSSDDFEYGLYFQPSTPVGENASSNNQLFLELLAEGLASMIENNNALAYKTPSDLGVQASGKVKTLQEYLEQAKIPETYGVPARVLDVLERRIGEKPLSIANIADELNLSKRTLQRRLQQQEVSFADLRDKVRFNYSIGYLVKHQQSIDSISSLLDFSDRTSFTNAFKRWTGLSPSTFRKLFRDYV